jgi:hypothetical protein
LNVTKNTFFNDKYAKGVFLIIFIYSLSITFITITFNPFFNSDNIAFYYFAGQEILAGHASDVIIPNASLGFGLLTSITDNPHIHMKIISISSAVGIIFFTFVTVRQIFNSKTAFLATIFISVYAGLHMHSYMSDADIFPIFLLFVSFYYITKKRLARFDIVMVAIFAGLSFTLKYQAAIIVIGFLIFFLIFQKPRMKKSIIFMSIFILTITPMLLFNYIAAGELITSNSSTLVLMEWSNVPKEWYAIESFNDSSLLFKNPDLLLYNFGNNIFENIYGVILNMYPNWNNLSIFPLIPFLGLIPLIGGIYFLRNSLPRNLIPIIISFLVYFSIMSIFAINTNPIRLFPPALIFVILCAVFFAKIDKKKYLIPVIIFIILINLGASGIMANWILFNDDNIFDPKQEIRHQELYDISQILSKEENIESKYLMGNNQLVAYHANSKFIRDYAFDGPTGKIHEENLDLESHILKKELDAYQIYFSKLYSYPISEFDLERIPDYLLIKPVKNIPKDWKILYESENYILLKISG